MPRPPHALRACLSLLLSSPLLYAQTPSTTPSTPAAPAPAAPAKAPALDKVEITGTRNETEQRRQAVAGKIVIGREEIEQMGDRALGDVLKRLPGVTQSGPPGRGGGIAMRGMGGGYTQILLDGQRVPPGFSIESLSPDQVERIEVLRAPTAETGARAIAGTINIITREGFTTRQESLRVGFSNEHGHTQPGMSWNLSNTLPTAEGQRSPGNYNLNLVVLHGNRLTESNTLTSISDASSGALVSQRRETGYTHSTRDFANLGGRLNLRLDGGDTLNLQTMAMLGHDRSEGRSSLATLVGTPLGWTDQHTETSGHMSNLRVNTTWVTRPAQGLSVELRGGTGRMVADSNAQRTQTPPSLRTDKGGVTDVSWNLGSKLTNNLSDTQKFVAGVEAEQSSRDETTTTVLNGTTLANTGGTFQAQVLRTAGYAQNEWQFSPRWSAYAGLRWEGIFTDTTYTGGSASNKSGVWTPLLHTVWKPFEESRDQLRASLTRSYRAPTLQSLIPRTTVSTICPIGTPQDASCADTVGNPNLKPELATGIELAYEHYFAERGLFSVNLFHRRITDLMRTLTSASAIAVPYTAEARFVSQTVNVGNAVTQGVELELKSALNELISDAPKTQLRINASVFRSHVDGVPGPNNRLSDQPRGTLNLGADHRFTPSQIQVGGNVNWTPTFTTQLSSSQASYAGMKRALELFTVVPLNKQMQVRVSGSNLFPRTYLSGGSSAYTVVDSTNTPQSQISTRDSFTPLYTQWQVRLEMKL